ncbi:MAG TPA: ABC transporter permease, partial [Pyrinomonadaceae bacterium]|nr:ABC transporter permease [Pyrinomonadaceae bacterium]
ASRSRVIRQSLVESVLLSLIGGAVGFVLAMWTITWLLLHLPAGFPRASQIGVNAAVFGFTFAVSTLTGIVFGLAPAIHATRTHLNEALKTGGKASIASGQRLRRVLVVAEVALSLMLFTGAGLLMKSFWLLTNVNPGFQADHLLTLHVSLPERKYSEESRVIEFYRRLPEQLSALPGVKAVSAVNRLPISGGDPHGVLTIEGRTFGAGEAPGVSFRRILPNYFRAMSIPLLQGREFDDRDTGGRPDVVIINQKMAQRYWSGGDAIGKRIKIGPPEHEPWLTIVGVVGNVNHTGLDTEPDFATYEPHAKRPWSEMTVLVRTAGDPLSLAGPVQQELKNTDKEILIEDVVTMDRRVEQSVAPQRLNLVLLATFAFIALVLAAVGIYGVMAHSVVQRTQEIGVRMALGAQLRDVTTMILRSGLSLALVGIAIGLGGALALTRLMSKLLFEVSPTDAATFVSVAVILFVVALVACYIPARRATKVDPLVALRYE